MAKESRKRAKPGSRRTGSESDVRFQAIVDNVLDGIPCKTQSRSDHSFHFIKVGEHLPLLFLVLHILCAKAQTRDRRSQIMCYCGHHLSSVLDEAADAILHIVEGPRSSPHLARAGLQQAWRVHIDAEPFCGAGKRVQGRDQPAHSPHREADHAQQHDRHGQDEPH